MWGRGFRSFNLRPLWGRAFRPVLNRNWRSLALQLVAVRSGGFAIDNDTSATSAIAEAAKNA